MGAGQHSTASAARGGAAHGNIAFDAHKHYTLASVVRPDGRLVREQRLPHERGALGVALIVAGPIAAALAGAGAGAVTGGAIGALVGAGIPEERVKAYESGLKEGGIVMGVKPRTPEDQDYFDREWGGDQAGSTSTRRGL